MVGCPAHPERKIVAPETIANLEKVTLAYKDAPPAIDVIKRATTSFAIIFTFSLDGIRRQQRVNVLLCDSG